MTTLREQEKVTFVLEDGVDPDCWEEQWLIADAHRNQQATIEDIAMDMETAEDSLYNIKFEDGTLLFSVSGCHFEEVIQNI